MSRIHSFLLIGSLAGAACSAPGGPNRGGPSGAAEALGADAGADPGGGPGGEGADPTGGLGGDFGGKGRGPGDGGVLTADAACAATALEPEVIEVEETVELQIDCTADSPGPINLYIVLDNSGSMRNDSKWQDAVSAITEFVRSSPPEAGTWNCVDQDGKEVPAPADLEPPEAGAISVAIQYFHPEDTGGGTNECDGSGHAVPAVAMGPLPDNGDAIVASLGRTGPDGDTPTVGALTGGTAYCAQYQSSTPGEQCIVVLVTDGQPNGCGLSDDCSGGGGGCVDPASESVLTPIVSTAYSDPANPVTTFTIGMDGVTTEGFALLDAIAVAGGSDCTPDTPGQETCNVSSSGSTDFLDALNTIRDSVQVTGTSTESVTTTVTEGAPLPCEWAIPSVPQGKTFDKDLVNVTVTTPQSEQPLGRVRDGAECASVGGGWYYDAPQDPTRLLVCPDTCSILERLTEARVDVLFGCATEEAVPR